MNKESIRTVIFIDGSNIYIAGRELYGIRVRPENLISILSEKRNISKIYYFTSEDSLNKSQIRFHESLRSKGIIVLTEEIVFRNQKIFCKNCKLEVNPICKNCGENVTLPPHKSKKIDILISAKMLDLSDTYDELILASGDRDFIPVIKILRESRGKKFIVASFKDPLSYEYRYNCDGDIIYLDKYVEKLK